ncbi:MAG: acetyl-CoA carboxylase, biotin carboxyl carrier protein [Clostridia bacterium]|nr:acetyl-CoA carboxylase, biotin carboxyl carrier protein [Clostridia bacterium]
MQLEDILKLISAVDETDFDKFELTDESFQLKLERRNYRLALEREGTPLVIGTAGAMLPSAEMPQAIEPEVAIEPHVEAGEEITSPLIGIFHALPDGAAVRVGDHVKKGDPICLIEAMKLMNEILMPEDGEITEVACEDNSTVEFGDVLFRFKK